MASPDKEMKVFGTGVPGSRTIYGPLQLRPPNKRHCVCLSGEGLYLIFLIGGALASWNFRQALHLLALWVPEHPLDGVIIPFSVFCSKAGMRLKLMGEALLDHDFAKKKATFPIGELDPSTGTSLVENGEVIKNH